MKFVGCRGEGARSAASTSTTGGAVTDSRRAEDVLEEDLGDGEAKTVRASNPLQAGQKLEKSSSEEISELPIQARDSIVTVEDSEVHVMPDQCGVQAPKPARSGQRRSIAR